MSSSPPFPSAQPRDTVIGTEIEDPSSDDSLYENSTTDVEQFEDKPTLRSASQPVFVGKARPSSSTGAPGAPKKSSVHPSTWLSQTAADRVISNSLDQSRARDLSVHLYNAHALKRRARLAKAKPENFPEKGSDWEPPKHWTAWPLPRNEVPPLNKAIWADVEDGEQTWRSLDHPDGPSEELCEQLIGVILKTAKARFLAEGFDHETENVSIAHSRPGSNHASVSTSRTATETEASASYSDTDSADDLQTSSSEAPSKHRSEQPLASNEANQSLSSELVSPKPKRRKKGKQPNKPSTPSHDPRSLKPVIMADEEKAASILQPSINHLLTKLDTLLMGLHHARRASLRVNDDSASETQTSADDNPSETPGRARGRPPSTRPQKRRLSHRQSSPSQPTGTSAAPYTATSTTPPRAPSHPAAKRARRSSSPSSKARRFRRQCERMGLRDWSDVLGIAAMQGWDRAVIDAAAGRCAALFGEGMDFRVVDGVEVGEFSYLPVRGRREGGGGV
ncbi:hypothetical protein MMC34_004027 [Xylographa carneopallida]|nr:hypothetical protein [Xylographa carneopallida]